MSNNRNADDRSMQNRINKLHRINTYSAVISAACFILGALQVALMEFFSSLFTCVFLIVMGVLFLPAATCFIVSEIKLRKLKKLRDQYCKTDINDECDEPDKQ